MTSLRRLIRSAFVAFLVLVLAACGALDEGGDN